MFQSSEILVEMLETAESFVVCAARVHRALREGTAPPYLCLCSMFRAAEIPHALAPFAFFQAALAGDPQESFVASERCVRTVSACEVLLLEAIACWQRNPEARAESALDFVTTPRVRSIAAPPGRTFALELATVGLWVRAPSAFATRMRFPALHAVH